MKYINILDRKLIILGFGSIAPPALSLILKHTEINPSNITVIADNDSQREYAESKGVKFEKISITPDNYVSIFSSRLSANDILLNLSVGISTADLIGLCQKLGILYMDTSNESWASNGNGTITKTTTFERRHKLLQSQTHYTHGPTSLICHGANPGLVTHFAKRAVLDIYSSLNGPSIENTHTASNEGYIHPNQIENWGKLAEDCGIIALHISERDTQQSYLNRGAEEYVNTWSIEGFFEEASENVGFAFGTDEVEIHQDIVKARINTHKCRVIELKRLGAETKIQSWIPSKGLFKGYLIPHPETYSIAELFSHKKNNSLYHPTVQFVYQPCLDALNSMKHLAQHGLCHSHSKRLLVNDIIKGMDELGILVIRRNTSDIYWYGSQLDINDTRSLLPNNNATSLQVAAGVLAGFVWLIENPRCGLVEPEQVDFERALEIASPYLGKIGGIWSKWPQYESPKFTSAFDSEFDRLPIAG